MVYLSPWEVEVDGVVVQGQPKTHKTQSQKGGWMRVSFEVDEMATT